MISATNNKKELITFLVVTFGFSFLLDQIGYLRNGLIINDLTGNWGPYLAFSMLIPAASSIFCIFLFNKSPIPKKVKVFFGLVIIIIVIQFLSFFINPIVSTIPSSEQNPSSIEIRLLDIITPIVATIGFIYIGILNLTESWRKDLALFKLSIGKNLKTYLIIPGILILVLTLSFLLNKIFNLGEPIESFDFVKYILLLLLVIFTAIYTNWIFFFGEEFGWRYYLQERLIKQFGVRKGILLLGTIWGLWHAPVILMGYNYPGFPIVGVLIMTTFTIIIGIIFSYAVIKTSSIWIAVLLHLIINNLVALAAVYLSNPTHPILSFGIGLWGIALLGVFGFVIYKFKLKEKV